jgi:hypothetical protein
MQILDLKWSNITLEGAKCLVEGLFHSKSMRMLDISWNSIGVTEDEEFGKRFGEALNECKTMRHLDIAYNKLKLPVTVALAEEIFNNHTLWGIHAQGNDTAVDAMGFLHSETKQ